MKIVLAQYFGMCFGVRDAIAQAEQLAQRAPLTILGELVHNPLVRERLQAQAIREGSLDRPNPDSRRVMITAHGASDTKRAELKAAGFDVLDGTCPLVRHAHEQLRQLVRAGYFPVVIGRAGHVEVRGLIEDFPDACVVDRPVDILNLPRRERYGVISQTTQPIERAQELVAEIRAVHPGAEVRFVDTVCKPTKNRQRALQSLLAEVDLVVVVGGRNSNNTRQLVAACEIAGRRTVHVERAEELRATDFAGIQVVGLTAGTSTMRETVAAVQARLEEISTAQLNQTNKKGSSL
jgi:4-hydroxy-3-methylbut-2-enyl diphosphate reductase